MCTQRTIMSFRPLVRVSTAYRACKVDNVSYLDIRDTV